MKRFLSLQSRDTVLVVSMAMFMAQLDAAVVTIALPAISTDFGVPVVSMSFAVTIYLTMLVAMLPLSGWAADRFGPRRVFLLAAGGFALFSLACAVAPGFWTFILARAAQGSCAALITPVARLIMLRHTPKSEMVDALAITAMPMLVAPTLGPSVGGFIVEYGQWEQVFLLDAVIAALLMALGAWRLQEIAPVRGRKLDWQGLLLMSGALIALLTGVDRLANGFDRPLPWALLGTGSVLAAWTWRHLRTHPHPIVTLEALSVPEFRTTVTGAGAAIRLPGRALLFALPLMLQTGFGYPPFTAGLMLMALNGGDLVTKPFVRPMYDRMGYRAAVLVGNVAGLAGIAMVALAQRGDIGLVVIVTGLLLAGISRSIVFTGMSSLTFTGLDHAHMNSGNVVASVSMQMFNALSVSLTALALSLVAGIGGRVDPVTFDYRMVLGLLFALGLAATIRLHPQLPDSLDDLHR